jgi:hypothetical protein
MRQARYDDKLALSASAPFFGDHLAIPCGERLE